jgi:GDP-4-dehydro-6-deoxy-D-mannose reductase
LTGPPGTTLPYERALVTGLGGFVGGYLAPALADAMPRARRVMLRRPGCTSVRAGWEAAEADIFDRTAVGALVAAVRPDLVVHLAAQSSVGASHGSAEETWRVNVEGTIALASACAHAGISPTVLFASSAEVYGSTFLDGPVDEDSPLRPQNAYARSKAAAENALDDVLPADARLIVARAFNHTGPGQDERFVLPSFAAQIARIESGAQPPELLVGNLDAARDFLDVRDVCDAYVRLLAAAPSLAPRSTFNVSSGTAFPIRDLVEILRSYATVPLDVRVDAGRMRPNDIARAVGRNQRLCATTSWRPTHELRDTLRALLENARGGDRKD